MIQNKGSGHNICMKLFVPNVFDMANETHFEKWKSYVKCSTLSSYIRVYNTDGKR